MNVVASNWARSVDKPNSISRAVCTSRAVEPAVTKRLEGATTTGDAVCTESARDALTAEPPNASAVPDGTRAADIPTPLSALIVPDSGVVRTHRNSRFLLLSSVLPLPLVVWTGFCVWRTIRGEAKPKKKPDTEVPPRPGKGGGTPGRRSPARRLAPRPGCFRPTCRPPWRAPTRRAGTIKNTTSTAAYTRRGPPRLQRTRLFFGMVVQKYSAACRRVHRPP